MKTMRMIGLTLAAAMLAGCQSIKPMDPPLQLAPQPLPDAANQYRNWNQTAAMTPDQDTIAGSVGFWWEAKPDDEQYESAAIETPLFAANTCIEPISFILLPSWKPVRFSSGSYPPSYTAMPPLETPPPQSAPARK